MDGVQEDLQKLRTSENLQLLVHGRGVKRFGDVIVWSADRVKYRILFVIIFCLSWSIKNYNCILHSNN